jgi:hypothetical protein
VRRALEESNAPRPARRHVLEVVQHECVATNLGMGVNADVIRSGTVRFGAVHPPTQIPPLVLEPIVQPFAHW